MAQGPSSCLETIYRWETGNAGPHGAGKATMELSAHNGKENQMGKKYDNVSPYFGMKKNGKTAIQMNCPSCKKGDVILVVRDPNKTGSTKCSHCKIEMTTTILNESPMW